MLLLLLAQSAPVIIPPDTPAWIVIALSLVPILGTALGIYKKRTDAWAEQQALEIARSRQDLTNLKSVRTEIAATVLASIAPNDIFKVLYIGNTAKDQLDMVRVFRVAGFKNQIITFETIEAGFLYLKEHPSTLFVIIYVTDIQKGTDFLEMVTQDETTKDIDVFFIDGNDPATALAAYQGGGAGVLKTPMEFTALLGLLYQRGLTITIDKAR